MVERGQVGGEVFPLGPNGHVGIRPHATRSQEARNNSMKFGTDFQNAFADLLKDRKKLTIQATFHEGIRVMNISEKGFDEKQEYETPSTDEDELETSSTDEDEE